MTDFNPLALISGGGVLILSLPVTSSLVKFKLPSDAGNDSKNKQQRKLIDFRCGKQFPISSGIDVIGK